MINRIVNKVKILKANRSYESKRNYLISKGCKIGKGTRLNCNINAFGTEPYLIEIGKNCLFAGEIHLITHDGGVKVLNSLGYFNGKNMDKLGRIKIGNNVYIGTGALIMPNVIIGDNCVIGANAIVTKNIKSNSVAVGSPAKVIKTIEEYFNDCKDKVCDVENLNSKEKMIYCEKNIL
ncbi:acyltransferase [Clostridium baratii]|uniref:acyltransferase n=1 Tax=Clostridium baratii TaxID=1561 RepID=UPI00242A82E7|nr:acyltransferase [Clostridium baratii]